MNTKSNIFLWALYDFANSFTQIAFSVYFAQWIVVEQGISDLSFNLAFVAAAFLLLLTVPVVGFLLDTRFRKISGLRIATFAMIVFYFVTAVSAVYGGGTLALILFVLGFYSFLLTFTFYTPLLFNLAPEGKRGKISGIGYLANFAGQVTALFVLLPFATGAITFLGTSPRAETLLPAIAIFIILALPMLVWFKEPPRSEAARPFDIRAEARSLWSSIRSLLLVPGVALFFLTHFLFFDAILTAANNFSIFLEQVWSVSDTNKSLVLLGIFITSGIGALVSGILADRFGHKRVFTVVVAGWLVIFPLLAFIQDLVLFIIVTTCLGLWHGASYALPRTIMGYLAPVESRNLAFGFFGLMERASSLLGPLVWGLIATGFIAYDSERYRFAMLSMTIFIILALIALRYVKSDRATS